MLAALPPASAAAWSSAELPKEHSEQGAAQALQPVAEAADVNEPGKAETAAVKKVCSFVGPKGGSCRAWAMPGTTLCRKHASTTTVAPNAMATPAAPAAAPAAPTAGPAPVPPALVPALAPATTGGKGKGKSKSKGQSDVEKTLQEAWQGVENRQTILPEIDGECDIRCEFISCKSILDFLSLEAARHISHPTRGSILQALCFFLERGEAVQGQPDLLRLTVVSSRRTVNGCKCRRQTGLHVFPTVPPADVCEAFQAELRNKIPKVQDGQVSFRRVQACPHRVSH